jgi:hypothetical protein
MSKQVKDINHHRGIKSHGTGTAMLPKLTTPENSAVVVAGSIGVCDIRIRSWLFPMVDDDGSENWGKNGKEGRKCHT